MCGPLGLTYFSEEQISEYKKGSAILLREEELGESFKEQMVKAARLFKAAAKSLKGEQALYANYNRGYCLIRLGEGNGLQKALAIFKQLEEEANLPREIREALIGYSQQRAEKSESISVGNTIGQSADFYVMSCSGASASGSYNLCGDETATATCAYRGGRALTEGNRVERGSYLSTIAGVAKRQVGKFLNPKSKKGKKHQWLSSTEPQYATDYRLSSLGGVAETSNNVIENSSVVTIGIGSINNFSSSKPLQLSQEGFKEMQQSLIAHYSNYTLALTIAHSTFPIEELDPHLVPHLDPQNSSNRCLEELEESISLKDLFNAKQDQPIKRTLLLGEAGVGKSALCKKIVHSWAKQELYSKDFEAIFYLPVEKLNALTSNREDSPVKFLAKAIFRYSLQEGGSLEGLQSLLHTDTKRLLFIIDGYDQASQGLIEVLSSILEIDRFHFIVTSRPTVLHSELFLLFDRKIDCLGFTREQMLSYCHWFLKSVRGVEKKPVEEFLTALEGISQLAGLAQNPLHAQLLCDLWRRDRKFPSSEVKLYEQFVEQMCDQYYYQKKKREYPSSEEEKGRLIFALGEAATLLFEKGELSPADLAKIAQRQAISFTDLTESGFLKKSGTEMPSPYLFPHPTFPEFFIAYRLSRASFEEQKEFILTYQNRIKYWGSLVFLVALIYQNETSCQKKATQSFFDLLCRKISEECKGDSLLVELILRCSSIELTFRCLKECPEGQIETLVHRAIHDLLNTTLPSTGNPLVEQLCTDRFLPFLKWLAGKPGLQILEKEYGDPLRSLSFFAARGGQLQTLQYLFQQKRELITRACSDEAFPLIHTLAGNGYLPILQWLYEQEVEKSVWERRVEGNLTFVHFSALRGHLEVLKWTEEKYPDLLRAKCDMNATFIHFAALQGHLDILKWAKKSDPDLLRERATTGDTFLHVAALQNHLEILEWAEENYPDLLEEKNGKG